MEAAEFSAATGCQHTGATKAVLAQRARPAWWDPGWYRDAGAHSNNRSRLAVRIQRCGGGRQAAVSAADLGILQGKISFSSFLFLSFTLAFAFSVHSVLAISVTRITLCGQVSDHGMETSLMDSVMNASRDFFRLPLEEKRKYRNIIGGKHFQMEGYGTDQVKTQDQRLDWSDRLHLKVEPEDERNLAHWPTHPKSFR